MAQISKLQSDKTTSNSLAELGRHAERAANAARTAAGKAEDMGRNGLTEIQRNATATLEAGRAGQDTQQLGQALAQLVSEQAQHNLEVFTQLTRTFNLSEAARIQADFLRTSLDRSAQFTQRYFETAQAGMVATMSMAKAQADKAR